MLRLAYLTILYLWYGGRPSSLSEEVPAESSDEGTSASTVAASNNASAGGGTPGRSSRSPAPASGSQLQGRSKSASAAELENAGRGIQSTAEHAQGANRGRGFGHTEHEKLLKRVSIVDKLTALTVLTSFASDLDLVADWYFLTAGLDGESPGILDVALVFTVLGTIMYLLLTVEFHFVSKAWTLCRGGRPLNPLQHVPLGWQLFLNVVVEDLPQLIITCVTSPTSVAGVLNIATAGFALLVKMAEGFTTRRDLPMSAQLRMVEEDPGVVRHMVIRQREAQEQAANAARLAVLVNQFRQVEATKRRQAIAFQVMRLDPDFLNGKLDYIRETLEVPELELRHSSQLKGPIPPALGTLTGLQQLKLIRCRLKGSIPGELGQLKALELAWFYGNDFDGTEEEVKRLLLDRCTVYW